MIMGDPGSGKRRWQGSGVAEWARSMQELALRDGLLHLHGVAGDELKHFRLTPARGLPRGAWLEAFLQKSLAVPEIGLAGNSPWLAPQGCWSDSPTQSVSSSLRGKPSCKIRLTSGEKILHSRVQAVVKWML